MDSTIVLAMLPYPRKQHLGSVSMIFTHFNEGTFLLQIAASSPPIGAIPSALFASFLLQWIGRKRTLILALGIYLLTFIALGTAPLHESYALILVSRSLTGVAVGLSMPAAQIYVSHKITTHFFKIFLINSQGVLTYRCPHTLDILCVL